MNCEVEPLRQAEDAIQVDSTNMTLDEEMEAVMKIVEEKLKG
jgi:cytidylate kinase